MQVTARRMTLYRVPEPRQPGPPRATGSVLIAVPEDGVRSHLAARSALEVVLANSPLPGVQAYTEQKMRWALWHPSAAAVTPPGSRIDVRI